MKFLVAILVAVLLAIAAALAAGPFLTINAIRTAVQEQDAAELSEHIDFPALRTSFRQQLDDYLARRAGPEMQGSLFGAMGLRMASSAAGGLVDAMASPAGLAAVLEGRGFLHRIGSFGENDRAGPPLPPPDPLKDAKYAFESPSRFTATILNRDAQPVVFVLTREGLRWKVTDVRLPW